jgi:hypothetical protein
MNRRANVKKTTVDAALVSLDYVQSHPNAIHPYVMLKFWSRGNAVQLQRLHRFRWGCAGIGVTTHNKYELMSAREFEGEFERSLKPQTDQTPQPRSPMRLQTRPVPWWRKWLLRQ